MIRSIPILNTTAPNNLMILRHTYVGTLHAYAYGLQFPNSDIIHPIFRQSITKLWSGVTPLDEHSR